MQDTEKRPEHLGWVEVALRAANPDLPHLRISAQSHFGSPNHIAFIVVHGIGEDRERRREVRAEAGELLRRLGYRVALEPGRDVFEVTPLRPVSAHDELRMLRCLRTSCGAPDTGL